MASREVTMIEITEVLRQWLAGARHKQIARRLGLDCFAGEALGTLEQAGVRAVVWCREEAAPRS
jgi:hypothetical protein